MILIIEDSYLLSSRFAVFNGGNKEMYGPEDSPDDPEFWPP